MSLAKVTSPAAAGDWALAATGAARMTARQPATRIPRRQLFIGDLLYWYPTEAAYSIPPQAANCNRKTLPRFSPEART